MKKLSRTDERLLSYRLSDVMLEFRYVRPGVRTEHAMDLQVRIRAYDHADLF